MSPWVDDPETGTSVYERPKKKRGNEKKIGVIARLAAEHNAEVAAQLAETARTLGDAEGPMESFGQRMARIKREKATQAAIEINAALPLGTFDDDLVPGDGKDPL